MKRIWSILLTMTVALTLLCPMTAYAATGEGNIDGGGGNLGDATSHGSWNPGNEGVRVTIVRSDDHAVVSTPIDLTNRAPAASIYHFGKVSKLQYTNGVALSPVQGSYTCIKPTQAVPRIISTNGRNNIEAIKSYFTDEQVIRATGILMRESINSTPPPFCRKFCWVFTPCARGRRASFSTATPM